MSYALNYNILSKGTSQYTNYDFSSLIRFGDVYLGCNKNGIFRLGGDADDGEEIKGWVKTGNVDFGISNPKKVRAGYLGYMSTEEIDVTLEAEDGSSYTARLRKGTELQGKKFPVSRNVKGRFVSCKIENTHGCDFGIDFLDLCLNIASHRL